MFAFVVVVVVVVGSIGTVSGSIGSLSSVSDNTLLTSLPFMVAEALRSVIESDVEESKTSGGISPGAAVFVFVVFSFTFSAKEGSLSDILISSWSSFILLIC